MELTKIKICKATKEQALEIARLIMMAMTDECCLYFCGDGYGLEDFRRMMAMLVEREDSQYSYRNTQVAMHGDRVVGASVSYDGGRLRELRQAFIEAAKEYLGKDHSGMKDETQAGELYLDSLAVLPEYRRQGIARTLLLATKERANQLELPYLGLLVDTDNPNGEALYSSVGFRDVGENRWGGHFMKHMILSILVALLVCLNVSAQEGLPGLLRKVGTMLDSMSVRGLDRRYIDAPEKPWQVIVRGNMNQSSLSMNTQGSIEGFDYSAKPYLKTNPSRYVGLWAGYRGYGLGYTVNVGGDKGAYLTFGAMGGAYGVNVRIHSFENSSPNFGLNSDVVPEEYKDDWGEVHLTDPIKVHTVIADGYYLFNGKRFSYAAAYDQSVLQKRSAGSLMAGAMYYYGHIDYASPSNGDLIYLMQGLGRVKMWQGSVGVGYAYNWVPARGLLVNVMVMPMLTLVNRIKVFGYATNVEQLMENPMFWDDDTDADTWDKWFYGNLRIAPMGDKTFNSGMTVNVDARLSLTYNFGRYFINAYGQFNNMRYRHDSSHGHLNDWFVNTSLGIRL